MFTFDIIPVFVYVPYPVMNIDPKSEHYIGCLNIHGIHVAANNSINNNVVFFFVSDLKIV